MVFNVKDENAAAAIARIADARGCQKHDVRGIACQIREKSVNGCTFDAEVEGTAYRELCISMIGDHQIGNALCALTALEILSKEIW